MGKFADLAKQAINEISARTQGAGPIPPNAPKGAYQTSDFVHQDFSNLDSTAEPRTIKDMASGTIPPDPKKGA